MKRWTGAQVSKGTYPVMVDDSWFPKPLQPGSESKLYDCILYIVSSGVNPNKEMSNVHSDYPSPVHISIAQAAPPLPAKTEASTNQRVEKRADVQPWVIVVSIISSLILLGSCVAAVWTLRQIRRRKLVYGEKGHLDNNTGRTIFSMTQIEKQEKEITNSTSNRSTDHETGFLQPPSIRFHTASVGTRTSSELGSLRMTANMVASMMNNSSNNSNSVSNGSNNNTSSFMDENTIIRPQSTASCSNISCRSEPPLSSTDALLIADTFRQRMRRPEWQQQQSEGENETYEEDDVEESNAVVKRKKEEEKRRQLSEELLKKELAAEGTSMKKVGKRVNLSSTGGSRSSQ
ncbi:hypothetical protein EC973_004584 [Apophysomyces ossiformis]|uniref:Uncharacterized protein n=1 Tax=Apophysomyces ossiformis TaxID=679940 RepID=A0A8H7BXI0_9FUNG|nr:hypothetical protein EC973_004584 [Apophysomyces ossiformis]